VLGCSGARGKERVYDNAHRATRGGGHYGANGGAPVDGQCNQRGRSAKGYYEQAATNAHALYLQAGATAHWSHESGRVPVRRIRCANAIQLTLPRVSRRVSCRRVQPSVIESLASRAA